MSATNEEKDALTDLNQRFLCYVNKVRRLKDEEDIRIINENVSILEEELRALKASYESQICQLSSTLDIVVSQKVDIERELMARQNNEVELNDRLAVEGARLTMLLHELSGVRSDMSVREQESISLSLTVQQLRLELADGGNQKQRLQRDLRDSTDKAARYEEQIRDYENTVSSLTQKIEFQDHFFSKKLEEMRARLEEYLGQMVAMDHRVAEAKQKECQWPLVLEQVKRAAQHEYGGLKAEAEAFFDARISNLQGLLDSEVAENARLKQANDGMAHKLLQLRKAEAELQSKVEQLQRQSDILDQAFRKDKDDSGRTIMALQNKIKQLQDNFMQELEDVKTGRGISGVQIKGEIEFLKRLLTEEEKRLHIPSAHGRQPGGQGVREQEGNEHVEEVSETDLDEENGDRYASNTSAEEFLQGDTDAQQFRDYGVAFMPDNGNGNGNGHLVALEEEFPRGEHGTHDSKYRWVEQHEVGPVARLSAPVGPVHSLEAVVGPVHPSPSVPHPPNERPPRPASANLRGIRAKTVTSQPEYACARHDCSSSASSHLRADSGLGQSPDYYDSVFRAERARGAGDQEDGSVSLTSVRVIEVNKDGKYIRLCNTGETQDAEIGNYMLKQNRFGHPVALFRFPERVRLPAGCSVTVWAGSNDPLLHQPPTDFFSEAPPLWGSGPEYTTVLCSALGQAVSWTSQPHRVHPDPFRAKTAPAARKDAARGNTGGAGGAGGPGGARRLPELATPPAGASDHLFIIRDDEQSLGHPVHHPFTSTPKAAIHPCMESSRGKVIGNDNSSLNRQSRQPSGGVPDPVIGQPYCGTNAQRMVGSARVMRFYPGALHSSHTINNRTPEVVFRSSTEPPSTFQRPLSRFVTGLDQVQSMHNPLYRPPMFKAEAEAPAH